MKTADKRALPGERNEEASSDRDPRDEVSTGPAQADSAAHHSESTEEVIAAWRRDVGDEDRTQMVPRRARAASVTGVSPGEGPAATPHAVAPGTAQTRFAAGATVGHYEIIRALGQGGMGTVYLARDTRLGRRVALKSLRTVDAQRSARFLAEARAVAQFTHENIVALFDIAEHNGVPYMVLEYVEGKTLSEWLQERAVSGRSASLPPARAAELMLQVARALMHAHEAGIVHRDLKPSNVMLADNGTVKVLDFGIAKLLGAAAQKDCEVEAAPLETSSREEEPPGQSPHAMAALTQNGTLVGTLAYMAPEQWDGEEVDERTDLWAAGIMLYEMVTGEHPLASLSQESLASVALRDVPMPSIRDRSPESGRLGVLIDRCLLKHKADRLSSARELLSELEAIARPHLRADPSGSEESNPYPGLSAFQEQNAAHFFGRENVVEQIVARLAELPLLAIVGSSGAGKSSLVRAGVIPALKRGGDAWEAFVVRPGPRPLTALAELLFQHSWQRSTLSLDAAPTSKREPLLSERDSDGLRERLRREPGFLGLQMRTRARRRLERVLLFVDQFEEIYTLAGEDERGAFLACLAGAADDPSSPLRVLISLRHDFLDRVAGSETGFAELVSRGTVLLGSLDRHGLKSALLKPAEAADHHFESQALVDEMLDALEGTVGALPLLQFTAAKLWEGRDRGRRVLTEASYRAFGGIGGALASHADSVLNGLTSPERRCARTLLLRLVTPDRTRALTTTSELSEIGGASAAELERVLGRLIDARLVTLEGAGKDESTIELVHESLIEAWPTLVRWLEEEQGDAQFRSRLRVAAREWEASGCAEGLLWRGEAADEAKRFHKHHAQEADVGLSAREARYLSAVMELGERERRRRRRVVTAVITGLCAVAVLVSALAVRASQEAARAEQQAARADAQRTEAEQNAARARNAGRLAAARDREDDPTTVLSLLREIEPGPVPRGWSELSRWARDTGVAEVVLPHEGSVSSVAWSPDGRRIASASFDKTVRVWNADGSGQPLVLRGHDDGIYSIALSPDGRRIASASTDKTVRVWNADGSGQPLVLRGHDGAIYSVAWSPDGRRIASASHDRTVSVWEADGSGQPLVLRGHDDGVAAVAWSPDGRRIVSTSFDKTVRVWNADGSGQPLVLPGHDKWITGVAWSPDGRRIVSASEDRTMRVWDADGIGEPLVLRGHDDWVYGVAFSPDGRRIASASRDETVRVWNTDGAGKPLVLRGHDEWVFQAVFSPDGRRIASASFDKTVRVWSIDGTGKPLVLRGHEEAVLEAAFSLDGRRIASASSDRTVRVWNADGSGQPLVLRGHDDEVTAVAVSPDAHRVASASKDKTIRIWTVDGSGEPLVLRGHDNGVYAAAWSPDGRRIVSASRDRTVRVWNADGSGQPLVLRGHDDWVYHAAVSADGTRVVSASFDKTVRVWNADGSGQPVVLRGHDDWVANAAFSPDGRRVASGSNDKTVRVWNADGSGQPIVLRGYEATTGVRGARAFSPDGTRLVTHSFDGTVRIWNADGTGEPIVFRVSKVPVNSAGWSLDGTRIVASSNDGTIVIWSDLDPLRDAEDPRLWNATFYCMPLEVRQRLLDFPEKTSRADLERCQRRVHETRAGVARPMP